jgi:predicted metal-dependent peptidase
MAFDLNFHIYSLLQEEPFFAALSRSVDKRENRGIPTAGVGIDEHSGYFVLHYNPDYFETLSIKQRKGVLKHEFYHLIFEHVTSRLPAEGLTQFWNIATDLAINSHLEGELPDACCMPGEGRFEKYCSRKTAEWYFDRLMSEEGDSGGNQDDPGDGTGEPGQESGDQNGEGTEQFDSHEEWGKVSHQAKEIAKERLKEAVKKASQECEGGKGWGSVSSSMRRTIIDKMINTPVDWRKVLRYFIKTSQRASKQSTIKKINRRYPYIHPGRKVSRQAQIAISIDQSGSVSDGMLEAFFGQLNELAKLADFTVIPFDDRVFEEKVFVWKKGQCHTRERVLCGGTCFDAPTEYVNEHEFDGHIILSDMYAPKPKSSKCQRMWMTDPNGASMPYFKTNEKIIVITT